MSRPNHLGSCCKSLVRNQHHLPQWPPEEAPDNWLSHFGRSGLRSGCCGVQCSDSQFSNAAGRLLVRQSDSIKLYGPMGTDETRPRLAFSRHLFEYNISHAHIQRRDEERPQPIFARLRGGPWREKACRWPCTSGRTWPSTDREDVKWCRDWNFDRYVGHMETRYRHPS